MFSYLTHVLLIIFGDHKIYAYCNGIFFHLSHLGIKQHMLLTGVPKL